MPTSCQFTCDNLSSSTNCSVHCPSGQGRQGQGFLFKIQAQRWHSSCLILWKILQMTGNIVIFDRFPLSISCVVQTIKSPWIRGESLVFDLVGLSWCLNKFPLTPICPYIFFQVWFFSFFVKEKKATCTFATNLELSPCQNCQRKISCLWTSIHSYFSWHSSSLTDLAGLTNSCEQRCI